MTDLPNGFTGFKHTNDNFESAAEASRKLQEALAAGEGVPRPSAQRQTPSNVLEGVFDTPRSSSEKSTPTVPFNQDKLDNIPPYDQRWAWVEIDLSAIRHNVAETRRYLDSRTRLMAVVSADAFGHGAVQTAKVMLSAGVDRLAVGTVPEALQLREAGITAPILLLQQPPATSAPLLLANHITPTVYDPQFAIAYGEEADRHGMMAPYHLALNTGMNRIGVPHYDAAEFLHQVSFHRALQLEGTYTQFATADSPETLDFHVQTKHFLEALESIADAGFNPGVVHAANSAATFRFPDVHFHMVRCGQPLYGLHPCEATRGRVDLRPAMSVHARITNTHVVPVSEGVSYGYSYRSPGSVKICTIPLGYGDGLRRALSNNTDFIMDGHYFRQAGVICADQCMFEIDLRNRKNLAFDPQVGDEVLVVGQQGAAAITLEELAEKSGALPIEMAIGFGQGLQHVYC